MQLEFDKICEDINKCTMCSLYKGIRNYVPGVLGSKQPQLMLIGEAPGFNEDLEGLPFVGQSGKILSKHMKNIFGLDYGEFTLVNVVSCRPPDNRQPTILEKKKCKYWLNKKIELIKPKVIVTLGRHALASMIDDDNVKVGESRNFYWTCIETSTILVPTLHPMATVYTKANEPLFLDDLRSIQDSSYQIKRERKEALLCLPSMKL